MSFRLVDDMKTITDEPILRAITARLSEAYRPDRIYLFGSKARGDDGPDSDWDVLVVVPDDASGERRRGRLGYEALWGMDTAVDVVVMARRAFDARRRLKASLPGTVLREGRLLYAV